MAGAQKIKIVVKRKFTDKHTRKTHQVGEVLSVTKRRYDEINAKDETLVSIVTE